MGLILCIIVFVLYMIIYCIVKEEHRTPFFILAFFILLFLIGWFVNS